MRRILVTAAGLALTAAAVTACSKGGGATTDPNASGTTASDGCSTAQQVATWDLKRRLGQQLMGGIAAEGDSSIQDAINEVAKGKVGGVNFLGDSYAYADGQLAQVIDAGGAVPPFLAVDQEGGRVQRLEDVMGYVPSAREMGATKSPEQIQRQAEAIGKTMRKLSLNMDLAPVVDVSDQPDDAVIGDRSFSGEAKKVTEDAGAFAQGLREKGIIPVLKHFPGLGSGSANTDFEKAHTPPLHKLEQTDLVPYETLLLETPVAVMVTNASVPELTEGKPATLAPQAYQLLRDQYGFQGVTMTDSLTPVAAQRGKTMAATVEAALLAGADIALWDGLSDAGRVVDHLAKAVQKGDLTEDQVNQSVTRILDLKGIDLCAGR